MIEDTIATLISTIGFPIVAFLLMYRMVNTTIKDNSLTTHKNTVVLGELAEAIKRMR